MVSSKSASSDAFKDSFAVPIAAIAYFILAVLVSTSTANLATSASILSYLARAASAFVTAYLLLASVSAAIFASCAALTAAAAAASFFFVALEALATALASLAAAISRTSLQQLWH